MTAPFDDLYRQFEDVFRGSRESIAERLRVYVPLLDAVRPADAPPRRAIDLGCGRGEWLGVLAEAGFAPVGVDLNPGMAAGARAAGLSVELDDALAFLRRQPPASVAVVTAFHLVEHLPFETLRELLGECHRVLEDDGLLILETPNPENLSVATWRFHIDPTHRKPLPAMLLAFLVEETGFGQTAILRLNGVDVDERAGPMEQAFRTLLESALDYACLARKHAAAPDRPDILSPFVAANSQRNPADLAALGDALRTTDSEIVALKDAVAARTSPPLPDLQRLHDAFAAAMAAQERQLAELRTTLAAQEAALARFREASATAEQLRETARRDAEITQLAAARDQAALQAAALSAEVARLRSSSSWRITAPLRAMVRLARSPARGLRRALDGASTVTPEAPAALTQPETSPPPPPVPGQRATPPPRPAAPPRSGDAAGDAAGGDALPPSIEQDALERVRGKLGDP